MMPALNVAVLAGAVLLMLPAKCEASSGSGSLSGSSGSGSSSAAFTPDCSARTGLISWTGLGAPVPLLPSAYALESFKTFEGAPVYDAGALSKGPAGNLTCTLPQNTGDPKTVAVYHYKQGRRNCASLDFYLEANTKGYGATLWLRPDIGNDGESSNVVGEMCSPRFGFDAPPHGGQPGVCGDQDLSSPMQLMNRDDRAGALVTAMKENSGDLRINFACDPSAPRALPVCTAGQKEASIAAIQDPNCQATVRAALAGYFERGEEAYVPTGTLEERICPCIRDHGAPGLDLTGAPASADDCELKPRNMLFSTKMSLRQAWEGCSTFTPCPDDLNVNISDLVQSFGSFGNCYSLRPSCNDPALGTKMREFCPCTCNAYYPVEETDGCTNNDAGYAGASKQLGRPETTCAQGYEAGMCTDSQYGPTVQSICGCACCSGDDNDGVKNAAASAGVTSVTTCVLARDAGLCTHALYGSTVKGLCPCECARGTKQKMSFVVQGNLTSMTQAEKDETAADAVSKVNGAESAALEQNTRRSRRSAGGIKITITFQEGITAADVQKIIKDAQANPFTILVKGAQASVDTASFAAAATVPTTTVPTSSPEVPSASTTTLAPSSASTAAAAAVTVAAAVAAAVALDLIF